MLNLVCAGNLGGDAETRFTPDGTAATSFNVAVEKRSGGEKRAVWIRCTVWGKRGESLAPYLKKGAKVTVCGQGDLREYQAKDGSTRTSLELRVDEITLQGGKQDGQPVQQIANNGGQYARDVAAQKPADDDFNSDIPF